MNRLKLSFLILLLISLIILMAQNSQQVTFRFLSWQYDVSQLLLVIIVLAIGFLTGVVTAKWPASKNEG